MPPVIPDYGPKRYAKFALDGFIAPACGCFLGALAHLLAGLFAAAQGWYAKSWAAARIDYHVALEAFKAGSAK
jgi:hypothetical protein